MKLKPMADNILLKQQECAETTVSGIILATTNKEKPAIYQVVAVGPGKKDVEMTVKAGDKVRTGQSLGTIDTINGQTQLHFELWKGKTPQNPETWLK